jgi:hypothetical protein
VQLSPSRSDGDAKDNYKTAPYYDRPYRNPYDGNRPMHRLIGPIVFAERRLEQLTREQGDGCRVLFICFIG